MAFINWFIWHGVRLSVIPSTKMLKHWNATLCQRLYPKLLYHNVSLSHPSNFYFSKKGRDFPNVNNENNELFIKRILKSGIIKPISNPSKFFGLVYFALLFLAKTKLDSQPRWWDSLCVRKNNFRLSWCILSSCKLHNISLISRDI